MDIYTKAHLEKYIKYHISEDHCDAFLAYALEQFSGDPDYYMNSELSILHGRFLDQFYGGAK